jgi:glycosyltransferase involved in cell wall biosynthesis
MVKQQSFTPTARISLVMPSYNHARFVGQALGALLAQARPADEIIIIDDASTDGSVDIIERLVQGRAEVSVIRKSKRGGAVNALNEGLERASGDLIAFPAADDSVSLEFLRETESLLERFPSAPFCSACVNLVDSQDLYQGSRPTLRPTLRAAYVPAKTARSMLVRGDNFFLGHVTLYRRHRLLELGGFDGNLGAASDGMMQRRMAARWGFCFVPKVLGKWRLHGSNLSTEAVAGPEKLDQLVHLVRRVIATEPPGLFPEGYAELIERRLRFNAARLAVLKQSTAASRDDDLRAICRMMHATRADTMALRVLRNIRGASALLSVAWLAMRLRPFSFTWLAMEALRRAISERPDLS